ncbi:uncharacterized protein Z518_01134 [Rhinocladiella mackenziei CBS 650.93]|uniref:Initiator tRNA phosphoribosyl transferase n=1 Tax=Rhinocladiella mackenziei CBS 650.93 TaxID=1442369 RepID=A0A0D2HHE6_9EURO|nr:uncharacterized protein Z518_01134 [Rhinocladiella mackenziei CBS 650.93]KIX10053.1 hypothetical protein Z518_01134 [Rhinocladiella mackenziei CBS 650.93]
MPSTKFPTQLAELSLNDANLNPSLYTNLGSIRKSALSIPNRLHSILADAKFAKQVSEHYNLPLVANERCGSWYIDPTDKAGSAYFKSTDGHHGQWDFSLRRLNLQLLPILGSHGGAVVVDSTRRGKNLPDALSKTVPIWATVINRALFPELPWTHALQHPPTPDNLGQSEISQIEARLDGFVHAFANLGLDLARLRNELKHPIHISWAVNGSSDVGNEEPDDEPPSESFEDPREICLRLVLCSASRRVRGAEISEGGYIQGAGDDSEGWSHGLNPGVFWKYREELMQSAEDELQELIGTLLEQERQDSHTRGPVTKILATSNIYIGVGPVGTVDGFDFVVNCQGDSQKECSNLVDLKCRSGKLGSKDLRDKLPGVCDTVGDYLVQHRHDRILVTCTTGKDLSAGIVVALLCLFYDDEGRLKENANHRNIDKQLVKRRLAWITQAKPDANPSRATFRAVNSFLIRQPPD